MAGTTPPNPFQVLIVEDRAADAELMARELRRVGFAADWQRVQTERDFRLRLTPRLDLILSDYHVPGFGAVEAMRVLRESRLDVPLLVVSGSIGDEQAAECLKLGATDYILKDRMARLGPAVQRALHERELAREKARAEEALRRSEEQMRGILATIQDVVWSLSLQDWKILYMSPAGADMFGRPVSDFYGNGQLWLEAVHPDDREGVVAAQQEMIRWGTGEARFRIRRADGEVRHIHTRAWCAYADGKPYRLEGINTDVTERLQAEVALHRERLALEEAQAIAHVGSWEWDAATDRVTLSKEAWRIWGQEPADFTTSKVLQALVHPDDRPALEAATTAAMADGTEYDCTVRVTTPRGELHTRQRGRVLARDDAGRPTRLIGTVEDITPRVQLEQAQKEARRLAELNEFKSQFLNMVAHDLSNVATPMRLSLHGLKAAVERGELAAHKDSIGILGRAVERLLTFLADLLDAARMQSGKLAIRARPLDLAAQVAAAVGTARGMAQEKGLALEAKVPPSLEVQADPGRVDQVLANLLSNAIKFTPSGGRVTVGLEASGGGATVSVADTGLGLAAEDVPKLFQPFSQLGGARQGKHTGTGLGLFLSRGIVEGHGGKVWVESPGPGQGSTFFVWLPSTPPAPPGPPDAAAAPGPSGPASGPAAPRQP
jgi:PAS domain S-box-containing protein